MYFCYFMLTGKMKTQLMKCLAEATPMAPRILNDLYMKSPTGQRLGILATFSNMRSAQIALGDIQKLRAVDYIKHSEVKLDSSSPRF